MSCRAKYTPNNGVKERGKASIEFYKDGKPQYYCYGYIDPRTDELLKECKECSEHVYKAQEDLEKWKRERISK